jgi:hypothetical protein
MNMANRPHQFWGLTSWNGMQRPRPAPRGTLLFVVVGSENHHADFRMDILDPTSGLQTVHARQVDIHHDHVGQKAIHPLYRLLAIRGLADDLQVSFRRDHPSQPLPKEGMVIHDEHPDFVHGPSFGYGYNPA